MGIAKQKKAFFFSVFASFLIHVTELHLLKSSSILKESFEEKSHTAFKVTKNEILKESFHKPLLSKKIKIPSLQKSDPLQNEAFHVEREHSLTPSLTQRKPFFSLLSENLSDLFKQTETDIFIPSFKDLPLSKIEESTVNYSFVPKKEGTPFTLGEDSLKEALDIENLKTSLPSYEPVSPISFEEEESPLASSLFESKNKEDFSDFFDLELVYSQNEEGKIAFALTFILKENIEAPSLKQNYLFVVDRSNSIQRERLSATKNAIQRALKELKEEDYFNILVFDQKIEKMHPILLKASSENIVKAQKFLEKVELGSFFSQPNLYDPLFTALSDASISSDLSSVILFTDGENFNQKGFAKDLVRDFTKMNEIGTSLHIISMTSDRFSPLLQTFSSVNKGEVITSSTHRGIKRKLLKLMKSIQKPIAKNLQCTLISRLKETSLEFFPKKEHAPPLYLDEPFVLIGSTDALDDFIVFIQGSLSEKNLHIKKNISFSNAKKASFDVWTTLEKQKAKEHFLNYLKDYNEEELKKANELAQNHALEVQFE